MCLPELSSPVPTTSCSLVTGSRLRPREAKQGKGAVHDKDGDHEGGVFKVVGLNREQAHPKPNVLMA